MSDENTKKFRKVNFLKSIESMTKTDGKLCNDEAYKSRSEKNGRGPNYEVVLYEINRQTDGDMQPRLLVGTSAWPINEIFKPGETYDLQSSAEGHKDSLLGILNKDKSPSEKAKVTLSGYQLVAWQDNLKREDDRAETKSAWNPSKLEYIDPYQPGSIRTKIKKIWEEKCRPREGDPNEHVPSQGKKHELVSVKKGTQVHYHAAINGGRMFGKFLKTIDKETGWIHYVKPVWHDPLWKPEKNEVIGLSVPNGSCELGELQFTIIKEPDEYVKILVEQRYEKSEALSNFQMEYAMDMLYEGEQGRNYQQRIAVPWLKRHLRIEGWGIYQKQYPIYGDKAIEYINPEAIVKAGSQLIVCKLLKYMQTPHYNAGKSIATLPRYTAILRKVSTFDKQESKYNSDAKKEYGDSFASKENNYLKNLTENNTWREYMSAIVILTRQTFYKLFVKEDCEFVKSNLYGEYNISEYDLNLDENTKWTPILSSDFNFKQKTAKENIKNLFLLHLHMWKLNEVADKAMGFHGNKDQTDDDPHAIHKVDETLLFMKEYGDHPIKPTRVGKLIEFCKKCNYSISKKGIEFKSLIFAKCLPNLSLSTWSKFWKERNKNKDYNNYGI